MLEKRAWAEQHARPSAARADARAARSRRHVRRAAHRAGDAGRARRRAVHAQRRLQHDVRPRRHRGDDDRDRARADRGPDRTMARGSTRRPGRSWRARTGGRSGRRAAARVVASASQRAVVRARGRAAGDGWRRARIRVDVAFGGAFYAIVDAEAAGSADRAGAAAGTASRRHGDQARESSGCGRSCTRSTPGCKGIYGTIFTARRSGEARPAERDDLRRCRSRSLAVRHRHRRGDGGARGDGRALETSPFVHEASSARRSPAGSWAGRSRRARGDRAGDRGSAWITGEHTFLIDGDDPLKAGFRL